MPVGTQALREAVHSWKQWGYGRVGNSDMQWGTWEGREQRYAVGHVGGSGTAVCSGARGRVGNSGMQWGTWEGWEQRYAVGHVGGSGTAVCSGACGRVGNSGMQWGVCVCVGGGVGAQHAHPQNHSTVVYMQSCSEKES